MRYTKGPDGEILQERDNGHKTCTSSTGVGPGSVCFSCDNIEFNRCSFFTGSVECPKIIIEPVPPPKQYCATRIQIRNMQRYIANNGGGNIQTCN
jgi:hypothetical protein